MVKLGFFGPGFGAPVIAPGNQRRQRHQYGLGAAARLQAKQGSAVEHQVEFNVAPAPIKLELPLAFGPGLLLATLDYG